MATRDSMEGLLQQCADAISSAQQQYKESNRQENYNDDDYFQAMQQLENSYNDLAKMSLSANGQQREQLHRMRLQLQQVQNEMTIGNR